MKCSKFVRFCVATLLILLIVVFCPANALALKPAGSPNYNMRDLSRNTPFPSGFWLKGYVYDYNFVLSKSPNWLAENNKSPSDYTIHVEKAEILTDYQVHLYYNQHGTYPSDAARILIMNYYYPGYDVILYTYNLDEINLSQNFKLSEFRDPNAPLGISWAIDYNLVRDLQNMRTRAGKSVNVVTPGSTTRRGYRYNWGDPASLHQWGRAVDFGISNYTWKKVISDILKPYKESANYGTGWNFTRIEGAYSGMGNYIHIDTSRSSSKYKSANPYVIQSSEFRAFLNWNGTTSDLTRAEYYSE